MLSLGVDELQSLLFISLQGPLALDVEEIQKGKTRHELDHRYYDLDFELLKVLQALGHVSHEAGHHRANEGDEASREV